MRSSSLRLLRATRALGWPPRRHLDVPLHARRSAAERAQGGGNSTNDAALYDVDGGIATITLNQPDNKNALSIDLVNAVGDLLVSAQNDADVRAIVLTNAGNTFCAGADLRGSKTRDPSEARHSLVDILNDIVESPKPVLGKIAGHCTGGGVGLAAACDISVASDDVLFGFTEVRLGVCPAVISVVCLPKLRRADASELFLSGERIVAARAAHVGLINRVAPREQLDAAMDEVVGKVVRGGPNALAASKQLIATVPSMPRLEAFDWTGPFSMKLFKSDEAREGIGAFRERRDAAWVPGSRTTGTGRA